MTGFHATTRLDDLMRAVEGCEGYRIREGDRPLNASLWILEANYQEFAKNVAEFGVPTVAIDLMRNRKSRDAALLESARLLHSFLAAAYTLDENTKTRIKRLYRNDAFLSTYEIRRDRDLERDATYQFVMALRGAATHVKLHTPSGRGDHRAGRQ